MSKKISWKNETRKVSELIPADYNPRSLSSKQRQDLLESVEEFGRVVPLIVNIGKRKDILIGGHQRTTIYADLGIEEIEVRVPSRELTEKEEQKLNLRLNKNTGSWDTDKLGTLDMELLLDVGFGDQELSSLWDNVDIIDEEHTGAGQKKEDVIPRIAPGEIFQLGNHRLMCGSAIDHKHVEELMGNDKADMIYTEPSMGAEYKMLVEESLENALKHSKKDVHVFYWTNQVVINIIQNMYRESDIENKRVCIWIKSQSTPKPKIAFNQSYEPCVYGTRGTPHLNDGTKKLNEILNKDIESDNQGYDQVLEYFALWIQDRGGEEEPRYHPRQKPISIHERPLKRCTAPGHIVIDLFGGSGSTLIACEHLGRKTRMMEEDPIQATIIMNRWEELTGLKAKQV